MLTALPCDGCGQLASPEHFARRLRWLEWTTRYRPVHVQALLLGGIAPANEANFLYSPSGQFAGEAGNLLDALDISREGKSAETILSEFQKRGLLLTYVVECACEDAADIPAERLLLKQLPSAIARIRRSLRPKRVVLFSREIEVVAAKLLEEANLGCPVLRATTGSFLFDGREAAQQGAEFRRAVGMAA